jgi:transposase InsO family protein
VQAPQCEDRLFNYQAVIRCATRPGGPASSGDNRELGQDRQHRDGLDIVHAIIDDHTRLA